MTDELHAFDPETGEVVDVAALRAENAQLLERVRVMSEAGKDRDRRIANLRGKVTELREGHHDEAASSGNGEKIRAVLLYWRPRCMPKAKLVPDSPRWRKVDERLQDKDIDGEVVFTVEDLCEAVDGACKSDFHVRNKYLDAETIFRNPDVVQRHIARAREDAVPAQEPPVAAAQPKVEHGPIYRPTPLDRIVGALRDEFGVDRVYGGDWDEKALRYRDWWAPCPIQAALGSPMRIREQGDGWSDRGGALFFACAHGCTHEDLFEAVRQIEVRCERRRDEAISRAKAAA